MYFVDPIKIEARLVYLDSLTAEIDTVFLKAELIHRLAAERMTHIIVESILDIGHMIIDGFVMRDPGSYEDIIHILVDESVIPASEVEDYLSLIALHKIVVKAYLDIDHVKLVEVIMAAKPSLLHFSSNIRKYLGEEVDVANTFSNN